MTSSRRSRFAATLSATFLVLGTAACGGDDGTASESGPTETGACAYPSDQQPPAREVEEPPGDLPDDAPTSVTISTDQGNIPISLDAEAAPCTVNSFLSLAEQGYFDDTTCHRLVTGGLNVLQCGDPSGTGRGGPGYTSADELDEDDPRLQPCLDQVDPATGAEVCTYTAGTVAMANTGQPDSNGSQFFLVFDDSLLGNAYTPFGRMSAGGLQVVQEVAAGGLGPDGAAPATTTTITGVEE